MSELDLGRVVGEGVPPGGAAGQIPVKASAANYDTAWQYPQYCRRNLLDNGYFVGGGSQKGTGVFPINQKGKTAYTASGITIDRWNNSEKVNVNAGYTEFINTSASAGKFYRQYLNLAAATLAGQKCTLSIMTSDGSLYSATGTVAAVGSGTRSPIINFDGHSFFVEQGSDSKISAVLAVTAGSIKVRAVKLEIGSYQTLAHMENGVWVLNEIPDFGEELRKCQRYLKIFKGKSNATRTIGIATSYSTTRLACMILGDFAAVPTISGDLMVYKPSAGSSGSVPVEAFYIWNKDDQGVNVRLAVQSGQSIESNTLYVAAVPSRDDAAFVLSCE